MAGVSAGDTNATTSASPSPKTQPPAAAAAPGASLSLDDLRRRVEVLELEKGKEAAARNYAQLERDRVSDFWAITKARLAAAEAALRRKSLEEEETQRSHSVAIKVYRDRINSLLVERAEGEAALKADAQAALQRARGELDAREAAAEAGRRAALHASRQRECSAAEEAAQCRVECEARVARCVEDCERRVSEAQERYERALASALAALEARAAADVAAAEAQRDSSVRELAAQQAEALREAREHYRATSQSQLHLVAALKGDVEAARQREAGAAGEARALRRRLAAAAEAAAQAAA